MKKGDSPDRIRGKGILEIKKRPYPFFLIFTDLDGTLLDHETYEWKEAEPALKRCGKLGIPIILVSSKTGAEMDSIRLEMGLSDPFISENGGGIFFPPGLTLKPPPGTVFALFSPNTRKWPLGKPYGYLVKSLQEIRKELNLEIRGFSDMTPEEISRQTGLDLASSRLAARREYDEPFIMPEGEGVNLSDLYEAAKMKGLNVTTGGRFFHLHGETDKGLAVDKLASWYRKYHPGAEAIALGDSPNDFSMLKRADHPVLICSSRQFPGLEKEIPHLRRTREKGSKGWNTAVLDLLSEKKCGGRV